MTALRPFQEETSEGAAGEEGNVPDADKESNLTDTEAIVPVANKKLSFAAATNPGPA
jgi:hypothetical protein